MKEEFKNFNSSFHQERRDECFLTNFIYYKKYKLLQLILALSPLLPLKHNSQLADAHSLVEYTTVVHTRLAMDVNYINPKHEKEFDVK